MILCSTFHCTKVRWILYIIGNILAQLELVTWYEFNAQDVVRRGIPMEKATNELIGLIKEHGRWVDPETTEN
jgi:hypothetical protein